MRAVLLTLVLSLVSSVALAASRVDFGPYTLNFNRAKVTSLKQVTNVNIHTSVGLTVPTLVISVYGADLPEDLSSKFIDEKDGDFIINTVDRNAHQSLSKSSVLSANSVLLSITIVLCLSSKNKWVILALLALFCSLLLVKAQDEPRIEVTLVVPLSVPMESFEALLAQGTATGSASFNYLTLELCLSDLGGSTEANLYSLGVRRGLKICAKGAVTVTDVEVLTTAADINLTSREAMVNVSFVNSYAGTYYINSVNMLMVQGDCVADALSTRQVEFGVCRHGKYSTFNASGTDVVVDFSKGCPADPEAVDFIPISPPISSVRPGATIYPRTWTMISSSWKPALTYHNGTDGGLIVQASIPANSPTEWWLYSATDLLFIRDQNDFNYSFAFEMSTDTPNLNITEVNFALLTDLWDPLPPTAGASSKYVYNYKRASSSFNGWSQTWVQFEGTLSSNHSLAADVPIAVYIKTAASFATSIKVSFRQLRVDIPQTTVIEPSQLHGATELITLRKPDLALDLDSRADCPHLQPGLLLWEDPLTWGGTLPPSSSVITVPANSKVLITSCSLQSVVYEKIIVPATSELIFNDAPIALNVKAMKIDGHLRIGSPTCRLYSEITITLHGQKTTANTIDDLMGSKGIGVDGKIDVHGKQYHYTWTRIAATILPGDDQLWLQDDVNWHIGQQVVVTTSDLRDEETHKNEVMTIKAIEGRRVQFEETFQNVHYGGPEYQAEVGLLSRRIVIQGDEGSELESFGGHLMVRGEGRFSGVRAYRLGQTNQLARYPFHFHLLGASPHSYVHDCTIERSFYRCVSIHDTHEMSVQRNVAFDVTGHCYYFEEGVEENNTLAYNLASFVHTIFKAAITGQPYSNVFNETEQLRLPADVAASGFYITNAYNRIFGNAASGGWAGFAFPNLKYPIGFSRNLINFSPEQRPVLEFDGNTAHSAGFTNAGEGIPCIYMGGRLWHDDVNYNGLLRYDTGRQTRQPQSFNVLSNTKTFACGIGIMFWGSKLEVTRYESYDCVKAGRLFNSFMNHAIVSATTSNTRWFSYTQRISQGFGFYDTGIKAIVTNVEYRNFLPVGTTSPNPDKDNIIFTALSESDVYKQQGISAVKNITLKNVPDSQHVRVYVRNSGASRYFNIVDWDGTTAGRSVPAIIGSYPGWWSFDNTCQYVDAWKANVCDRGTREVVSVAVTVPGLIEFDGQYSQFGRDDMANIPAGTSTLFGLDAGVSRVNKTCLVTRTPLINGVSKVGWHISLTNGAPRSMRVATVQIPYRQWILYSTNYPAGTTFNITVSRRFYGNMTTLNKASSITQVVQGNGDLYYFSAPHLYVKMIDRTLSGEADEFWESEGVRLYNIYFDNFYNIEANCPDGGTGFCTTTSDVPTY